MTTSTFPSQDEIQGLEILKPADGHNAIANLRSKGHPDPRYLMERSDFISYLGAIFNADISGRTVQRYLDLKLAWPAVRKQGKTCFVYPDHFELICFILKLRRHYRLPLKAIRPLVEHLPREYYHLAVEQKLSLEELLDLAETLPLGFGVGDLIMAKTCDLMVEDVLSPSAALIAATEPGDRLRRLQEEKILARLEEIRNWVTSGRREEFVSRESEEEIRNLVHNQYVMKKIATKLVAKKRRAAAKETGRL